IAQSFTPRKRLSASLISESRRRESNMIRPENSRPSDSDDDDMVFVDLDDPNRQREPPDPELLRARKLASWRNDQAYLEQLKKYRPAEYEEIMKLRAARGIKPPELAGEGQSQIQK